MAKSRFLCVFVFLLALGNLHTFVPAAPVTPSSIAAERKYDVELIYVSTDGVAQVDNSNQKKTILSPPPKPLLVAVPKCANCTQFFPVAVFNHGFDLSYRFYSQLLTQISSYGFIMVAPKMYDVTVSSDATQEMKSMVSVISWLSKGLSQVFFSGTGVPEVDRVALTGHSRGGKVVFGVANGIAPGKVPYWAIAGVDPVDGTSKSAQTKPPVLSYKASSFNFTFPALLIGSGLGPQSAAPLAPACAQTEVGHNEFFQESKSPAYHITALEYGHMDFLDDETPGLTGVASYLSCKNGPSRGPARNYTASVVAAFLSSARYGENSKFKEFLLSPDSAPIKVRVEWKDPSIQVNVADL